MSFAASIIARLGLDTSGFKSDLKSAATSVDQAHSQMAGGARRNAAAHEGLLSSNHRVARQIQNFSKDLISGASATDIFSAGLEGLERSLKLSIGQLAALGVGAVAIQQIGAVIGKYEELEAEIDKVTAPHRGAGATPLSEMTADAESARKALEDLDKSNTGFWRGVLNGVVLNPYKVIRNAFKSPGNERAKGADEIDDDQRLDLIRVQQRGFEAQARHQKRLNAVDKSEDLSPDVKSAIREALEAKEKILEAAARGGELLAKPLIDALEIKTREAAKKIAQANGDRVKSTLTEIADRPEVAINDTEPKFFREGEAARAALKERDYAETERLAGHEDLSFRHLDRAHQIETGIGGLKESEKSAGDIRDGIDSSAVLAAIRAGIERITFQNR